MIPGVRVLASLDWGDVPTWIGAVATMLAFIAAWVAARAAWRVLELERTRDRLRREVEDRVQADRVAAWPSLGPSNPDDPDSPEVWGATVRNASELPVYQVKVEFQSISPTRGTRMVIFELVVPGEWHLNEQLSLLYPHDHSKVTARVAQARPRSVTTSST
jgi:hypothetical protein